MFKPQMKFQKILFLALLIFSACIFVYSLGLMTNLYGLYQVKAVGGVTGSGIFDDMQGYNDTLLTLSIVCILAAVVPYVVGSNSRRKYYIGNIVGSIIQVAAYLVTAVVILINTITYRSQFVNTVDFESWASMAEAMKFNYSESTIFFDLGFVLVVLLIVASGLIIYNLNWKRKIVKQEDALLKGEGE